ncbi:MAG: hypothetical protein ACRCY8_12805 [Dermatophilaceae bacterium]
MPTSRPRHQVTETPDVARALDVAARRWPREPRSRLLLRLVEAGSRAVEEERSAAVQQRLAAIDATRGKYADAFPDDHLAELRQDWPG